MNAAKWFKAETPTDFLKPKRLSMKGMLQTKSEKEVQVEMNNVSSELYPPCLLNGSWSWEGWEGIAEQVLACIDDAVTCVQSVTEGVSNMGKVVQDFRGAGDERWVSCFDAYSFGD